MASRKSKNNVSRQTLLVALLISILLHQLFLTGMGSVLDFSDKSAEKRHEVVLREETVKKEKKKERPPEVIPEPKKTPRKMATATPQKKPKPSPMQPVAPSADQTEETEPPSETESLPDPMLSTGPEPTPDTPPTPPNLDLNWKSFDKMFGAKAAVEREAYAAKSLERRRGRGAFGNYSARVMRALNNNSSFVKPGQQEVLGSRQSTFHNYIEAIHRASIHPLFADSFLASLPSLSADDPLNNWDLHMVAEFEIFESGKISEIRVIKSSGNMVFDAGAVDSIYRSSPFPPPPKSVLSWNRRVYLRWGFYRNHRKCGVFNVEPYILKAPGATEESLPVDKFTVGDG